MSKSRFRKRSPCTGTVQYSTVVHDTVHAHCTNITYGLLKTLPVSIIVHHESYKILARF